MKISIFIGDAVHVKPFENVSGFCGDGLVTQEGYIHYIVMETEELLIKFNEGFHRSFEESDRYNVLFTYSRTPFRRCHLAVKVSLLHGLF